MLITTGNIWDLAADARCVTTNGVVKANRRLVMGAGIAFQAAQRYPDLPTTLGRLVRAHGNCAYLIDNADGTAIFSLPTKHHWRDDSDISLIVKSLKRITELTDLHHFGRVLMTPPGCGHGNLYWDDVREVIEPLLDDRFTVVCH